MGSEARSGIFWLLIALSAVLLWQSSIHAAWLSFGVVEIWIALLFLVGAAWPALVGRRMQLKPLFFPRGYTLPLSVQVTVQFLYVAVAIWFLWHGVVDLVRK